jgi:hypothetical protein
VADRAALRADCAACFGLCCVVPAFSRSADFALDKPAHTPCPHLDDFACSIHAELRPRGFPGCTTYDCFGAGQQVARHTYAGVSWREAPTTAGQMFRVFETVRALHELLWMLEEAVSLVVDGPLHDDLVAARDGAESLAAAAPVVLDELDVEPHRRAAVPLLRAASEQARAGLGGRDLTGADLTGARLRDERLVGASLRGALLLGADLCNADLDRADLTGADLRGADVRGARLSGALFLTRRQVGAARGDHRTSLPDLLERPDHWA